MQASRMVATASGCISPREASDQQVLRNGACYGNQEDADTVEIDFGRVALRWDATDTFSVDYSYDRTDGEATAAPTQVGFVDASTAEDVQTIDLSTFQFYNGNAFARMAEIATDKKRLDKLPSEIHLDLSPKRRFEGDSVTRARARTIGGTKSHAGRPGTCAVEMIVSV